VSSGDLVHSDVEAAIARVLAAEADAALALRAAEIEAQEYLEAARARARRIAERTGERLQRITLRIEAAGARSVADLASAPTAVAADATHDGDRLLRAVDAIAAELTGARQ